MLPLFPKNFVPKLKPVKTDIYPSPINLNNSPLPKEISEIHEATVSITELSDSRKDTNIKRLNFRNYHRKIRNSSKNINIEEQMRAKSNCEDNSKK